MNSVFLLDEGDGLATPFVKGKSLSQQIREEREAIEKKIAKHKERNEADRRRYHEKKRVQIHYMKPDMQTNNGHFIKRGKGFKVINPLGELPGLEAEIKKYFKTKYKLSASRRFQELISAKRMFIFFATIYLKLPSRTIAQYLDLDRSTLSHHVYQCMQEIDIYPHIQYVAQQIENYLWNRHEQLRS